MLRKIVNCVVVFVFLYLFSLGAGLVIYPLRTARIQTSVVANEVSAWRDTATQSKPASEGKENPIPTTEPESSTEPPYLPELLAAMEEYNQTLFESKQEDLVSVSAYEESVIDLSRYGSESEAVGIITIPAINIEMSVFLGANGENMAKGFAHMGQTSLPIGGENTNCVVAGHRGWNGAPYMRDAHLLNIGDVVYLENFWQKMEYRIVAFEEVWPDDIESIMIQPGKDLLTIVTCTPYGRGYQRLLIFCERCDTAVTETT